MQLKIKVTPRDVRIALERHKKGWTMESPLTVALEREGYKGAVHSTNLKWPAMWAYNAAGTRLMKIALSRRAMSTLSLWWANKLTSLTEPITFFLDAETALDEPHFPGYTQ